MPTGRDPERSAAHGAGPASLGGPAPPRQAFRDAAQRLKLCGVLGRWNDGGVDGGSPGRARSRPPPGGCFSTAFSVLQLA